MGVFRLFLALSVLVGHSRHHLLGLALVNREIALQTFFVISGFYMALILNEKYIESGRYWTFLQQRFLRLYPTYFIILLLILLVDGTVYFATGTFWGSLRGWNTFGNLASPQVLAFMVAENLIVLGQDLVMLLQLDATTGSLSFHAPVPATGACAFLLNVPAWSLAAEFSFYLVAPFLVCRSARTQVAIVLACFVLRAVMFWAIPFDNYHWVYFTFPPNLLFFMTGSLGYILYTNYGHRLRMVALSRKWLLAVFGLIGLTYSGLPFAHQLYLVWFPMVFVMVPLLFALTRQNRTDRFIGELSYPFYLIHSHVLMFIMPLFSPQAYHWLIPLISAALTFALAYLFYRFIEMRTERFRERLYRRSHSSSPALESIPAIIPPPVPG
jgi:peptidoglycan/LPS O-acetylase OafA/YrhL